MVMLHFGGGKITGIIVLNCEFLYNNVCGFWFVNITEF